MLHMAWSDTSCLLFFSVVEPQMRCRCCSRRRRCRRCRLCRLVFVVVAIVFVVVVVVVVVVAVVAAIDVACVVVEYGALSPVFGSLSMVSSPLRLFLLLAVVGFLGVLSYGAQNRRVF